MPDSGKEKKEHILACLSASPSNTRIIRTAAKMANAYGGKFTALYVKQTSADETESDRRNLEEHIRLAEQLGADVATVFGEDISYQIAEFARLSGVTQIVLGRSSVRDRRFWPRQTLTEKLVEIAPEMDIVIIPDAKNLRRYRRRNSFAMDLIPTGKDLLITVGMLAAVTLLGTLFIKMGFTETNVITVYILSVLLTALFTRGYLCSMISAVMGVILFNFFLTEPRYTFHAYGSGYPVTFAIMLAVSIITGTLAAKLKDQAKLSAQAAFRTQVLFDTNQQLQTAENEQEIIRITATQIMKMLRRDVIAYTEAEGRLAQAQWFPFEEKEDSVMMREEEAARWALEHHKPAGAGTQQFSNAQGQYLPIHINENTYGVLGIDVRDRPPEVMENSVMMSIIGEGALAISNMRNAAEKERAAVLAKNEQLRANLLRTISHDLRTPLTTISGNADTLLTNEEALDEETRRQVFTDIYEDAQWLNNLVENLLSVSRIEDGKMRLNMSPQNVDEVISEALRHTNQTAHPLIYRESEDLLLAKMDARLIVQVIINLVGNAVKYTPEGTPITVSAKEEDGFVFVSVADEGRGIPDEEKEHIFEMFYTGEHRVADSRRSIGLGLALCKSIVSAHGGEIFVTDNEPCGSVFTFSIPAEEKPYPEEENLS